jgi:hypothetical protein
MQYFSVDRFSLQPKNAILGKQTKLTERSKKKKAITAAGQSAAKRYSTLLPDINVNFNMFFPLLRFASFRCSHIL